MSGWSHSWPSYPLLLESDDRVVWVRVLDSLSLPMPGFPELGKWGRPDRRKPGLSVSPGVAGLNAQQVQRTRGGAGNVTGK